jgi:branched-chain amino acid transport system substrate-binding protein
MFSPCSSNPKVTQAGDYVFRNWPSDNYEGSLLAENAKNNLGVNKVAILYINNDYGVGLKDVFKAKFESFGGTVAVVESFDPNDKDFRTQLIKIKQAGADAIYVDSNPEEQPLVLNQIKQMGIKKIILGNGPSTETQDLLQKAKSAAEGMYFVSAAWKNPDWFKEQYKAKYGQDPAICSDVSYDALTLVALAIDKCGVDTACARDNLYQVKDYDGVAGKTTLDSNGDVVGKDFILKVIKNGQFVPYQK